ncbi:MAG: ATP-binding protein [Bacteroidota bacterium]|nr:ATP-binding protein [Bacteroidota bacterium]
MHRVVLSFLISFLLLMIVIALNRVTYDKSLKFTGRVEHSLRVIKLFDNLDIQLRSAEIYTPTYENTSAKDLYTIYKRDLQNVEANLLKLRDSISDNKEQVMLVDTVQSLIQKQLPVLRRKNMAEIIASGEIERFKDLKDVHGLVDKGLLLEENLLASRRADLTRFNRLTNTFTLLLAILAIIIITITFFNQLFISRKSKWLEGFLESILNTSQNGILHCKAIRQNGAITDFKLVYANTATKDLLSIDPKKLIGTRWTHIDALKQSRLFNVFCEVVQEDKPLQIEYLNAAAATEQWYSLSLARLDDGVTAAFHDITEVKKYQGELKENITALKQSNRELEEYAYAASHDLQEPLRKIRTFGGYLQDTQKNKLDEKGRQQLEKMMLAAERMTLLIRDLLSFSSLKSRDELVLTDLNEILQNVLLDFEILIAQKRAVITHDPLPEMEAIPVQMNQLFYNLVSNSLKFAKDDLPLHLDIGCQLLKGEELMDVPGILNTASYYEIVVSDNGIGFNPDYAAQIFGLFKRLNDKSTYKGSGIGLALCQKVVTNHGGVITANGKEGVGAQFYIYLPQKMNKA